MSSITLFQAICGALLIIQCIGAQTNPINKDLVNKKVERNIDIASQLVKIHTKITLENTGKTSLNHFHYAIEPRLKDKLSFISATTAGGGDDDKPSLKIHSVQAKDRSATQFLDIQLSQPLEGGRTVTVEVETVFTHALPPYPTHIAQNEKQLVLLKGNLYLYSPYPTTTQTTNVVLASSNVESFTKVKPFTHSDSNINYGPYENIAPLTEVDLQIHYENNNAFLTVTHLERVIEVSHWGNIAIEESIHISHKGAILKGSFSRYEYQREQSGVSSVKSFKTVLPAAATDVYYRDEIGNISTSHLRILEDAVEADLRPRFPLFGGWKTHYILGYNLPSYEYLFNKGDEYALKIRFVDHIYDDMAIDHVTVRIILPEGSKDLRLNVPFDVTRSPDESHSTYLDTTGRPVVVVHKDNLVENHIQEFELLYKYQKLLMLQEPLLVVLAFYLLFLLVILYVRLDFSITKDEQSEGKLRVSGLCERVQEHQEKILALYQRMDNSLNQLKSNKDVSGMQATNKKINAEHKVATQAMQELRTKLKTDSADAADKVSELIKLDQQLKESYAQQIVYTEKLVSNKIKKDQYVDQQQTFISKKDELLKKVDAIVSSF